METTERNNQRPSVGRTILRFSAILGWLTVLLIASYGGLFIHAFLGMFLLSVLTFLTIKQANARTKYLKDKRKRSFGNYHVGEEYLKIFAADK